MTLKKRGIITSLLFCLIVFTGYFVQQIDILHVFSFQYTINRPPVPSFRIAHFHFSSFQYHHFSFCGSCTSVFTKYTPSRNAYHTHLLSAPPLAAQSGRYNFSGSFPFKSSHAPNTDLVQMPFHIFSHTRYACQSSPHEPHLVSFYYTEISSKMQALHLSVCVPTFFQSFFNFFKKNAFSS